MRLNGIADGLLKLPLQTVDLAQACQVKIDQGLLIAGMVAELAVVVITGIQKLDCSLKQPLLCLALPGAAPDRLGMAREHRSHRISVLVRQGLHRPS